MEINEILSKHKPHVYWDYEGDLALEWQNGDKSFQVYIQPDGEAFYLKSWSDVDHMIDGMFCEIDIEKELNWVFGENDCGKV